MSAPRPAGAGAPGSKTGARVLRIGTRASALALWQANRVADLVRAQPGAPAVEIIHVRTEGDARGGIPLWQAGGRAFFTKEIDRAVLTGEVDIAVHSLKDLPTALEDGLTLVAVLEREDPRDALLARAPVARLEDLPAGARIGTSSLRRRAFIAHARSDLEVLELRGNVPTRVERLQQGGCDAVILAAAGLKRLELDRHITAYLPPEQFPPAVSQGAIGVVSRAGDRETEDWVRPLDHLQTRLATLAERALLRRVEGGCQIPLGALGRIERDRLAIFANVCALDGSTLIGASGECSLGGGWADAGRRAAELGERAESLGGRVGQDLLARGALKIIEQQRGGAAAGGAADDALSGAPGRP
ncbi:MAG: hydroxymethylbilane synthase [Steroidobacteraceae bacterium]